MGGTSKKSVPVAWLFFAEVTMEPRDPHLGNDGSAPIPAVRCATRRRHLSMEGQCDGNWGETGDKWMVFLLKNARENIPGNLRDFREIHYSKSRLSHSWENNYKLSIAMIDCRRVLEKTRKPVKFSWLSHPCAKKNSPKK